MNNDTFDNLIDSLISTINNQTNFKCEKADDEIHEEFERLDLELNIKRLFQWRWFSENIDVGPIIYSAKNILKSEKENSFLNIGLIQIGDCSNGDEIFLRVKDFAVLYWSHDESENWQKDERSLFLTYNRIESLLLNICNKNFIPWDSYSAREYFELCKHK